MTATDTNTSDPRSTTKRLTILIATSPLHHADVNDDGNVTPLDALLILLRRQGVKTFKNA